MSTESPPEYGSSKVGPAPVAEPGYDQYQPPQQRQTVIVMQQPVIAGPNMGYPQNIVEWSTGICGCFEDCSSCCYAYWCYPCFHCTLAFSVGENSCGPFCCGCGFSNPYCLCLANPYLVAMRTKLRTQYGIRGGICNDICCMWCCEFCATTQMMRQLKHHGRVQ